MRKYKIVIIENDEDEQFFMKEAFDASGTFTIIDMVINGNELFDWLSNHTDSLPDIILTDLNMPGKNGYDIIQFMTSNPLFSHIPVIVTSTSSNQTVINKCLSMGASEYIVKPETFVEYPPYINELHKRIEHKQLIK